MQVNGVNLVTCLAEGVVEKVGAPGAIIRHHLWTTGKSVKKIAEVKDHRDAIQRVLDFLLTSKNKIVSGKSQIKAVGHRIVHGGKNSEPVVISDEVKKYLMDV